MNASPRTVTLRDARHGRDVEVSREIGRAGGRTPGPLLVCVGGVHGNEPSGMIALRSVFDRLAERKPAMTGTFVGLAGNLAALAAGRRFIDEDLNRIFLAEAIARAHRPPAEARAFNTSEERELADLLDALHDAEAFAAEGGDVTRRLVIDLHTTSAESGPWLGVEDPPANLAFAEQFPAHSVGGLSKALRGCMTDHLHDNGWVGFTLEAGRHDDPASVDAQEACLWLALVTAGLLGADDVPDLDHWRGLLAAHVAVEGRRHFRVVDRHRVHAGVSFKMRPGYVNFQPVRRGEVLADADGAEVASAHDGRILMPLYQQQGDDGFFIVRE